MANINIEEEYSTDTQITKKNSEDDSNVLAILNSGMEGVEGLPYQFLSTTDPRIQGTTIGRKYAGKILSNLPLLFLTPCRPVFMEEFSDEDKSLVEGFVSGINAGEFDIDLLQNESVGRYYTLQFAYDEYYNYLDKMLQSVAKFLGIADESIIINGESKKIGNISWYNEAKNDAFQTFFSGAENIIFFLNDFNSVSESYSNETDESSIANQINGYGEQANELRFLFGKEGAAVDKLLGTAKEISGSLTEGLVGSIGESIMGGMIGKVFNEDSVSQILQGGKIIFPKIWKNSQSNRSYSLNIKLRSPDNDSLSIFLNVIKPYCKILAMTMPQMMENNANGFNAPFLVRAYCKGAFNVDYGIISSLNVEKGAQCAWNDDGLPTQIDISIDIEDLYSSLSMSYQTRDLIRNTSYLDFLANMAGLNIAQMEIGRRIQLFFYLSKTNLVTYPSRIGRRWSQAISRAVNKVYNATS